LSNHFGISPILNFLSQVQVFGIRVHHHDERKKVKQADSAKPVNPAQKF